MQTRWLAATALASSFLTNEARAQCPNGAPPPCAPPARVALSTPPSANSIAVLPFANRSPDTSDTYLAEGMADEIANQLTRLGRLQVRARSAVAAQWRRTPDAIEAARKLNVAWVVQGHVRQAGPQLVVNVELVRTTTGEETWAARFPRRAADVFAVQAEVAESVAVAVGGRLTPGERAILNKRLTRSDEAYRLYLLGNSLAVRRTTESLNSAVDAYTRATSIDPSFGAAWARLAIAGLLQLNYDLSDVPMSTIQARVDNALARARALDSTSSDALLAAGITAYRRFDMVRARADLERAVQRDTLNEEAVGTLAFFYTWFALDSARAEPLIRRALALNPDRRVTWLHLFFLRWFLGHRAAAAATLDTVQSLGPWAPAYGRRAEERYCAGDTIGVLAAIAEEDKLLPRRRVSPLRTVYRLLVGDTLTAQSMINTLRTAPDSLAGPKFSLAQMYFALGRRDDAIASLERTRGSPDLWRVLHWPCFAPLTSDPRFQRLLSDARPRLP